MLLLLYNHILEYLIREYMIIYKCFVYLFLILIYLLWLISALWQMLFCYEIIKHVVSRVWKLSHTFLFILNASVTWELLYLNNRAQFYWGWSANILRIINYLWRRMDLPMVWANKMYELPNKLNTPTFLHDSTFYQFLKKDINLKILIILNRVA